MYQPWDNDPSEQQETYEVPDDTCEGDTYEVPGEDEQETYEIVDGTEQGIHLTVSESLVISRKTINKLKSHNKHPPPSPTSSP